MSIKTKRLAEGVYEAIVNGHHTGLLIVRGDPPKYRMPQEWSIEHQDRNEVIASGFKGKHAAVMAIETIMGCIPVTRP